MKSTEYHIHADLQEESPQLEAVLRGMPNWGFDPFIVVPGTVSYGPQLHYTLKTTSAAEFQAAWRSINQFLDENSPEWRGYFEAEALFGKSTHIEVAAFDETVPLPFTTTQRILEPGRFRRNELHIYFDDTRTDQRVKDAMAQIGFLPAWCEYPAGGIEGIWTIQAETIHQIVAIRPVIEVFLRRIGGTVGCIVDEERVVGHRMSHPDVPMAPVIDRINWRK